MNKTIGNVHIAGSLTTDDWKRFRATLTPAGAQADWGKAFEEYFYTRLSLRYLGPIKVLQDSGSLQGEGFSIAAIQCSLIEFLESTVQGKSYRFLRKSDPALRPYEYSSSSDIFISFLRNRTPFDKDFKDDQTARDFYEGVRCALLHEARTKKGWTIWAKSHDGRTADPGQKIMYRNNFQAGLLTFVEWYKSALLADQALQQAFLRKFDGLWASRIHSPIIPSKNLRLQRTIRGHKPIGFTTHNLFYGW
jgi:hypothetical protein